MGTKKGRKMTITNERLEAILAKHPGLRPKRGTWPLDLDQSTPPPQWFWCSPDDETADWLEVEEQDAHALIFRAMVEQLPDCDGWLCGPEAFENLVAYWEAQA